MILDWESEQAREEGRREDWSVQETTENGDFSLGKAHQILSVDEE